MNEYKWIAKKENLHCILVSQLSRDIEKRYDPRPRMSDFAESSAIEHVAESAIFTFYGYQFDDEKYSPYQAEFITAKSRYGKTGTYIVGFNGNKCSFYDSEEEAVKDEAEKPDEKEEWIHTN